MRNEMNEHRGAAHHTVAGTASSRVMSTDRLALHTLLLPSSSSSKFSSLQQAERPPALRLLASCSLPQVSPGLSFWCLQPFAFQV